MSHVDDGQLNALLDGELSGADARAVESHLTTCADCRRRLEEARAFLSEANALLDALSPAGAAPPAPAPQVEVPARPSRQSVPVRPVGQLADLPFESGPVKPMTPPVPPPSAPMAPSAKEPQRRVMKTAREVAVDIDGRTALTPGIRPVGLTDEAPAALPRRERPPRRGWDLEKLAWAANIVLALGVGYLANEVRWMHAGPPAARVDTVLIRSSQPPTTVATGTARPAAPSRGRPARQRNTALLDKPERARGPKATRAAAPRPAPAPDHLAAAAQPRAAPAEEGRAALGAGLAGGAGQPAPAAARPQQAAAPLSARNRAAAPTAAMADEVQNRPTPGFTRITMEEAVRTLSGSIRQIDGMTPIRIESAGGRLVGGSDPSREVVRVNYTDQFGRRFTLDQQLAEPRAGPAFSGIMPGDTLVTITAEGNSRVRWMDGKFWLSLTGPVPADEVKALVARVR